MHQILKKTLNQTPLALLCIFGAGCFSAGPATAKNADNNQEGDKQQELLIEEDFSDGLENWVWVGPPGSIVEMHEGALLMDPLEAEHRSPGVEGINLWNREKIPEGDWAIEFDVEPLYPTPSDGESCNLLFMVDYRYEDPELDLIEEAPKETGHYPFLHGGSNKMEAFEQEAETEYHPKRGYTITYYRINPDGDPPYMMIVRRNPGFHLVERVMQTEEDQWAYRHTVRVERRDDTLRLFQDDKLVLEAVDSSEDPVPAGGHFGIRTWKTKFKLHGVRAYRLEP